MYRVDSKEMWGGLSCSRLGLLVNEYILTSFVRVLFVPYTRGMELVENIVIGRG